MTASAAGSRLSLRSLFGRGRAAPEKVKLGNWNESLWHDPIVKQAYLQMELPRREIDITVDDPALVQKFMDRVIAQWRTLGESEPYWSNAPMETLKRETLDPQALDDFYRDGDDWMRTLAAFESRSGVRITDGVCVELGAGVGKYTHALAQRFKHVVAIDVSAGGLAACDARLKQLGLKNVVISLLTSPDDLTQFENVDLFLSLSTLQHNPPPVQKLLLDRALAQVKVGGFCLFQTPDWLEGYKFSSKRFLTDAKEAMCDCHCLPKTAVLDILEANDMRLLDFAPDFTVERFGSYTYFARKQPPR